MDLLAGSRGSLGAVGQPDHLLELYAYPYAHCDGGDYFDRAGYPQTVAEANENIQRCAAVAFQRLNAALGAAGQLVDANGAVRPREADIGHCDLTAEITTSGAKAGSAKCQVLNQTGRALHAIEDFWSHSNWADAAGPGASSVTNPPGLLHSEIPDFFRYATHANSSANELVIPDGLITGCDDSSPLEKLKRECGSSDSAGDRVKHKYLNKDRGEIDPRTGAATDPTTPRGKVGAGANFTRAVAGARAHASQTWADLTAMIRSRYPGARGETIVAALASDHPWTSCEVSGSAANAHDPPRGVSNSATSATITIENRTASPLRCGAAVLDAGEWASLPPDEIGARGSGTFRAESKLSKLDAINRGSARYGIAGTPYALKLSWKNPFIGYNDFSCGIYSGGRDVTNSAPYRCDWSNGGGNNTKPTFTLAGRSRAAGAEPEPRVPSPAASDRSRAVRPPCVRRSEAPPAPARGGRDRRLLRLRAELQPPRRRDRLRRGAREGRARGRPRRFLPLALAGARGRSHRGLQRAWR